MGEQVVLRVVGAVCHDRDGWRSRAWSRNMAKDPVCGMSVDEKKATGTVTHGGKT
jgi:hypothetical protein